MRLTLSRRRCAEENHQKILQSLVTGAEKSNHQSNETEEET